MRVLLIFWPCCAHVPYEVCCLAHCVWLSNKLDQYEVAILRVIVFNNSLAEKRIQFCTELLRLKRCRIQISDPVLYTVLRLEQLRWELLNKLLVSCLITDLNPQRELTWREPKLLLVLVTPLHLLNHLMQRNR